MNPLRKSLTKITSPLLKLLLVPLHVVSTPNRVLGMSLPRRSGVFVFVMLAALGVVCFFSAHEKLDELHHQKLGLIFSIVAAIIISTPLVVEYMVKTWLDHEVSKFEDIDEAWSQGLAKLREAALSLSDLPLFLVLGAPDEAQAISMMGASSLNLTVVSEPQGEGAALRWFAGPDAAVLFVSTGGCLSRLAVKAGEPVTAAKAACRIRRSERWPLRRRNPAVFPGPSEIPENVTFERTAMSPGAALSLMSAAAQPAFLGGIGTLTPDFGEPNSDQPFGGGSPGALTARRFAPLTLTREQAETATARLEHVCRLLLKERRRCRCAPSMALLTVLPFELIARGEQEASDLCNSVKTDLTTLRTIFATSQPGHCTLRGNGTYRRIS